MNQIVFDAPGLNWLGLWCLMSFSTIFQLYRGFIGGENGGPAENHRSVASHWQTLS